MSEIVGGFHSYMVSVPGKCNCRHQVLILVVTIDFDILVLFILIFGASQRISLPNKGYNYIFMTQKCK